MKTTLLAAFLLSSMHSAAQTKEQTIGCWKMLTRSDENLQFNRDGSFSFNDYSTLTKTSENLYGTWKQEKAEITLMYDDRPQQRFYLFRDKAGKWRLRKAGGFQFVKAMPAECSAGK